MKYIYSNWVEYARNPDNSYNIPSNLYKITTENEIVRKSLELVNSTDHPSLIIIDEISKFTSYDLDLVNLFAKNNGITVLVAGDFDLSGVVGKHPITLEGLPKNNTWNVSLDRTNFIRSPKLGVSMRTDNVFKTNNLVRTLEYLNNPEEVLELEYTENEKGLFGDKVFTYDLSFDSDGNPMSDNKNYIIDLVLENVEKLAETLKEGEQIGYIYTDTTSKLYQELSKKPYIDLKKGGSAQGLEGRYYIVDIGYNSADPDIKTFLKDLYTGISRAQQGSIIIAPYGEPGTNKFVPIKTTIKSEVAIKEKDSDGVIKKYAQKRKDVLDKVVTDGKVDSIQPRTPTKPIVTPPQTDELQSGPTAEELAAAQLAAIEVEKQSLLQAISQALSEDDINLLITNSRYALLGANTDIINAKTLRLLELANLNKPPTTTPPTTPTTVSPSEPSDNSINIGDIIEIYTSDGLKLDNSIYRVDNKTETRYGTKLNLVNIADNSKVTLSELDVLNLLGTKYKKVVPKSPSNALTPLSREEIESRFGERSKISNFTINIDGLDIPVSLDLIPFVNIKKETGSNNIINYYKRNIVVVNIGGFHMPFYMSTGAGGKVETLDGEWYPFFGIGSDGWLNKTNGADTANYYNSPIFAAISKKLNELLGTGLLDEILGPLTFDELKDRSTPPLINFINQDMNPTVNNTSNTRSIVDLNIQLAKNIVQNKVNEIKKSLVPETPLSTSDPSEDDIAPIPLTSTGEVIDIVPTAQYQVEIDLSNESKLTPEAEVNETTNEPILIEMLLHSFNTFETGVLEGDNGEVILIGRPELIAMRIDSVNGLIKIDDLQGTGKKSLQKYVDMLGDLRSIIFNHTEKADIELILADYLGLPNIYTTFALKSSPRIDKGARTDEFGYFGNSASPLNKSNKEQTIFNGSKDIDSGKIHDKSLVIIIGSNINGKNQNLLELPLLALSSPFTLLKVLKNGVPAFPEVLTTFEDLARDQDPNWKNNPSNLKLALIAQGIIDKHQNDTRYKELIDLFKLFLKTGGFIKYIRDTLWTPAKNLLLLGAHVVNKKGYYLMLPGLDFNDTTNPESEWIDLADFACDSKSKYHKNKYGNRLNPNHNPSTYVTPIFIAINDQFNGIDHPVVHKGHPFVLVSYDNLLNDDKSVIELFLELERDPNIPKKVVQMYVSMPKAKVSEYLDTVHKITHVKRGETLVLPNIGYFTTYFKLLKGLIEDSLFKELLFRKLPKIAQKLIDLLDSISFDTSIDLLSIKLNETLDWSEDGYSNGPLTLKYIFRGVLSKLSSIDLELDDYNEHNKDNEAIKIIEDAAMRIGVDGIYYHFPIPKNDHNSNGYFIIPNLGDERHPYTIDGKPCKIHGKVDSYTFKGHMGGFISLLMTSLTLPKGVDPTSPNANNRYHVSRDGGLYFAGDSSLASPPIRTLLDKAELERRKEISNIVTLVSSKTGILLNPSIFEGKTIQLAKIDIANLINSTNSNNVAFVMAGMLLITDGNPDILGNNKIIYSNGLPITDITSLIQTNGVANFEISIDGKIYLAELNKNNTTLEIWELKQAVLNPAPVLSITIENTTEYIQEANNLLTKLFKADKKLGEVFKAVTYDEFITALNNLPKSAPSRANKDLTTRLFMVLKIIDGQSLTPLLQQIVDDLMAIEEYKRQEVNNNLTACPTITKLFF